MMTVRWMQSDVCLTHRQLAVSELGAAKAEVLAQLRYDLPASYGFHR